MPTVFDRRIAAILALLALTIATSCTTTRRTTAPIAAVEPASATGVVKSLAQRLEARDISAVYELLADDFVFVTAVNDSAGQGGVGPGRSTDFIEFWSSLLLGSASNPAPTRVTVNVDRNLRDFPDTRPGMDARVHRTIRSSLDLKLEYPGGRTTEVTGYVLAFATRGDSAAIPLELEARGFKPDSSRWWLQRYEDETLPASWSASTR